jgi:hypothetical protein
MSNHRRRTLVFTGMGLLGVWLVLGAGWLISNRAKATAEKVAAYLHENDLSKMSAEHRSRALRELSEKMAALPIEERRKARMDDAWEQWFAEMTEAEKGALIEATLPSGFKQMLASFEQLPEDKRRRAVTDALRDLRKAREAALNGEPSELRIDNSRQPELSEELQQKVVNIGLQAFYTQSSAQTKAELAPVLEEMQRLMENGALLGRRRR